MLNLEMFLLNIQNTRKKNEYRNECEFFTRNNFSFSNGNRSFDFDFLKRQIPCRLIAHQHGDFRNQLAELFGASVLVPKERKLVLNQRMIHDKRFAHKNSILPHDTSADHEKISPAARKIFKKAPLTYRCCGERYADF